MKNKAGWDKIKLKDVGQIVTGNTPKTSVIENYSSKDFCFFKPGDLRGDNISILYKSENYISKLAFKNTRNLPIGSVLVTCIGTIGNVGVTTVESATNQQINAIIPSSKIDSKFLAYVICSLRQYLNHIANAPIVPIINKTQFSDIDIYLPPLPIQRQIVSELDALSDIITKKKQQLEELDRLAQATFHDMFENKNFENVPIIDVIENKKNIERASKRFSVNDEIEYIDISSINNKTNTIIGSTHFLFSNAPSRAQQCIRTKDILISLVRPNLNNVAFVKSTQTNLVASTGFCILRTKSKVNLNYLFYIVTSQKFRDYLMSQTAGANYPAVREDDVKDFKLPLAPLTQQEDFSTKIESIEKQKELINKSIADVQQLFDYTMDKYFN
jgi:type I restriction enzyme S subunit